MSVSSPSDPGSPDPTRQPTDLPAPVNPALLTALTTEHFTLQGARAATISESSSRSALYISAVASSLVALGFVAQLSKEGDVFHAFAFTVLPTLFVLGLFTWVRLTETASRTFNICAPSTGSAATTSTSSRTAPTTS